MTSAATTDRLWQNSLKSAQTLQKVVDMLEEVAFDIRIFKEYEYLFEQEPSLEESLVAVFVDFIKFSAYAIKFLSNHPVGK
jgi:hypothetical protein